MITSSGNLWYSRCIKASWMSRFYILYPLLFSVSIGNVWANPICYDITFFFFTTCRQKVLLAFCLFLLIKMEPELFALTICAAIIQLMGDMKQKFIRVNFSNLVAEREISSDNKRSILLRSRSLF